jgi:c-di-GMP-binding flagellar brake protein YcgR
MEYERIERRRATRYPMEAKVIVYKSGGEAISATAADISAGGMLLNVERPSEFRMGEHVTVDVELPDRPGMPFSAWGAAIVVRADGCRYAIQLQAGTFDSGNPAGAYVVPSQPCR